MQLDRLWKAVLGELEIELSSGNFLTWFKASQLVSCDNDAAIIQVGSVFIKNKLEAKYRDLILEKLRKNGQNPAQLEYKIKAPLRQSANEELLLDVPSPSAPPKAAPTASSPFSIAPTVTGNRKPIDGVPDSVSLNSKYIFDTFIVGSANELAFAACQSIALMPGTKYNPLYLYGGVGIGKTHLMQAVGNAIISKNPDANVIYINTEQFVKEFVQALRFRTTAEFARHYRSADVLIVDDIQFIAGKEKIQEEFFHTFNSLHQTNKQIIMSSDKPPKEIPSLEDRLRSRFAWGMSIDMQTPDFETRCAIVQTKAMAMGSELDIEVVEYLATVAQDNIRELEGSLNQLLAWCEVHKMEPSASVATSVLGGGKTRPKHLSAKQIIERTARHFQVQVDDMLGPKRDKDIVVPRQVAMYMMRSELHLSFPKIARELGRKDHTTAIHSVEKIQKEVNQNSDLRTAVQDIKDLLYA
ncbi:MAG: chromosomal replication initiation protein DnaA [Candidatus Saccharibacteria bacterium]|nr:chromosomal replication initiation protein DnaA [Candidatus Saccharibacteria bacterium]